jgi:hypothetical protein
MADAGTGGCKRQMRAFGTVSDAPGLDHVAEKAQIGQVESHRLTFLFREGSLPKKQIAHQRKQLHLSLNTKLSMGLSALKQQSASGIAGLHSWRCGAGDHRLPTKRRSQPPEIRHG